MGIKATFKKDQLASYMRRQQDNISNAIVRNLQILGEMCVNHARENHTYTDRTGNLTSSIAYVVYADGLPVHSRLEGTEKGKNEAMKVATSEAHKVTSTYVLVVVAGMPYAYHVEALGQDVLTSAEHLAEREYPRIMERLKKKISNGNA